MMMISHELFIFLPLSLFFFATRVMKAGAVLDHSSLTNSENKNEENNMVTNNNNNVPSRILVLQEDFLEDFDQSTIPYDTDPDDNQDKNINDGQFLRRGLAVPELPKPGQCRAVSPLNICLNVGKYCNQLANYPCMCNGVAKNTCTYCMLRPDPDGAVHCQVSGSLITFLDQTNTMTTCGCEYLGNGQVHQSCYQEAGPVPIPAPAVMVAPPTMPAPVEIRAPTFPTAPYVPIPIPTSNGGGGTSGGGGGGG